MNPSDLLVEMKIYRQERRRRLRLRWPWTTTGISIIAKHVGRADVTMEMPFPYGGVVEYGHVYRLYQATYVPTILREESHGDES